jgi:GTP-binding protein
MPNPSHKPSVALVGRPNVGKSALFNRLAARQISIVHDQPGVTRDRIAAPCPLTTTPCELVDTGGIGADADIEFTDPVTAGAHIAMETAEVILFLVDAREGVTPVDQAIAEHLRSAGDRVCLILNKADVEEIDSGTGEFASLGFGAGLPVSAAHGRNTPELLDLIDERLKPFAEKAREEEEEAAKDGLKVAVVGKPNAGKSSLINAILENERTIVSDVAGTTRDSVDIPYEHMGELHTLIDTAGLRPRSRMDSSVEVFSAMRAERSIRRSDICLLVVDVAAGVSAQDRKIARQIAKEGKPCLIVANKFDLYHPGASRSARVKEAEEHIRTELFFLHYAPFSCISAKEVTSIGLVFDTIRKIRKDAQAPLTTGKLNRILADAMIKVPPPQHKKHKKRLKLLYATSAVNKGYTTLPVPTYILFVNDKRLLHEHYQHYLEKNIRTAHPSLGLPVNFSVRSRRDPERRNPTRGHIQPKKRKKQ